MKEEYLKLLIRVKELALELRNLNKGLKKNIKEYKIAEKDLEDSIYEIELSLARLKTFTGLFPVCASCKKIRDKKGRWMHVDEYLEKYSKVRVTHSICPVCSKKLYPEIYQNYNKQ
jgi:uncharacterized protein with PIN domain